MKIQNKLWIISGLVLAFTNNANAALVKQFKISNKVSFPIEISIGTSATEGPSLYKFMLIEPGKESEPTYFKTETQLIIRDPKTPLVGFLYELKPTGDKAYLKFTTKLFSDTIVLEPQLFVSGNIKSDEIISKGTYSIPVTIGTRRP